MKFAIIAAADTKMGIGFKNRLPWKLKGDLQYFSAVTTLAQDGKQNAVIMGRKTWESLPKAHQPLAGRLNVVLSRGAMNLPPNVMLASALDSALNQLEQRRDVDKVFVIGGASIYAQAINSPDCEKIYLTQVQGEFNCDAFFPLIPESVFKKIAVSDAREENGIRYHFVVYNRVSPQ